MTETTTPLVRPLFDGPIDIIGDVHGEIDALLQLLEHLGYSDDGVHPRQRRLVFLGDLTDRGPDSPAVVRLVKRLVEAERAQCLLGNHELNLLLQKNGQGSAWFYGCTESQGHSEIVPQALADANFRELALDFFRRLPLALVRDDVRAVHACWDDAMIELAGRTEDLLQLHREHRRQIDEHLQRSQPLDEIQPILAHQNFNPVKVLTSGSEERAETPFWANGKLRRVKRRCWWDEYAEGPLCVFGHYWRTPVPGLEKGENLFSNYDDNAVLGRGRAMCIDYSVGGRWKERLHEDFAGSYVTRLAALRWPERELSFDDGSVQPLIGL
jgi:hypothetical protein